MYFKISSRFWNGETGKKIRLMGPEIQVLAFYLMSSPHANMSGVYYIPTCTIAHETGLTLEGASKGLQRLFDVGFCVYDEASEHVWVYEMASYQIEKKLKHDDNRVIAINKIYRNLPKLPFLKDFFEKYKECFHLKNKEENEAPLKPLQSPSEANNSNSNSNSNKKKLANASKKEKRKTDFPSSFEFTERHHELAVGLDLNLEFEKFQDHHGAIGNKFVDWSRAFCKWLRKANEIKNETGGKHVKKSIAEKLFNRYTGQQNEITIDGSSTAVQPISGFLPAKMDQRPGGQ